MTSDSSCTAFEAVPAGVPGAVVGATFEGAGAAGEGPEAFGAAALGAAAPPVGLLGGPAAGAPPGAPACKCGQRCEV